MDPVKLPKADAIRKAEDALKVFWSTSAAEFPENMTLSWEQFLSWMRQRGENFFIDFGNTVAAQDTTFGLFSGAAHEAMRDLARHNQGKVAQFDDGFPRGSDFFDALVGQLGNWSVSRIWNATKEVSVATAKEAASIGGLALTGYVGAMIAASAVGLFLVILSFRKKQ